MIGIEQNYDFRERLCKPHRRIYRNKNIKCQECEIELISGTTMRVETDDETALCAANDFIDYLKTSFGIRASFTDDLSATVTVRICASSLSEDYRGYMGRKITVEKGGILIEAFDGRGVAQALYSLEERMNTVKNPYLKIGVTEERPMFSPRMVHSGYGIDMFPSEYLSTLAHNGYDAILIYVRDKTDLRYVECDFNDLVARAKLYGIDTYIYSTMKNFVHPSDEGAKEIYSEVYGSFFRNIKGLRGMVFVGESIEFPSKDPHVACRTLGTKPPDGIPDGKITPGWWPCVDYPEWISLVRDSIRREAPDADVVFWTYNFGYVEEKYRLDLIRSLPTDISLLVTFEMFDKYQMGNGEGMVMDYTISHTGPGAYFTSEAEVAKERGIRLYSMVNTGGRTWDFGVAPYEPFPYKWNNRHNAIISSKEKYGLCGLMESHHFGFLPSFISRLTNSSYTLGGMDFEQKLLLIAKEYAGEDYEKFITGIRLIDDSMNHYVPSDENQYGPFRVGPAFPLCLNTEQKLPNKPGFPRGNGIYYTLGKHHDGWGAHDCYSLRIKGEIAEIKKALSLAKDSLRVLRSIKNKNADMQRLVGLVAFIGKCYASAINVKSFYIWRLKLLCADTKPKLARAIREIERIAKSDIKIAEETIPIVERDSSLGFEATMGYQCDREALLWKIKQVNYMLTQELDSYKRATDPDAVKGRYFKFF